MDHHGMYGIRYTQYLKRPWRSRYTGTKNPYLSSTNSATLNFNSPLLQWPDWTSIHCLGLISTSFLCQDLTLQTTLHNLGQKNLDYRNPQRLWKYQAGSYNLHALLNCWHSTNDFHKSTQYKLCELATFLRVWKTHTCPVPQGISVCGSQRKSSWSSGCHPLS